MPRPRLLLPSLLGLLACGSRPAPTPVAPAPTPPPAPAPAPAPAPEPLPAVGSNAALLLDMRGFRAAMCACTDATCVQAVTDDMNRALTSRGTHTLEPLDQATSSAVVAISAEMTTCSQRIAQADAHPRIGRVPAACAAYLVEIEHLARCENMPLETRDLLRQTAQQTSEAWKNIPPEAEPQVNTACAQATEAVRRARLGACP